ncbi:bifunctional riboflavin kinase/FMN phosphatase-like [Quillaja saponaria]|uniref:riboflavin kinase n=1 Tax=Quillaja saponaria TaxID=32244 RepID=A0AAD7PB82_QUISA|nr:bifunctional riboflavin kinase/FMN phosphatase-like [Quillaja saponaria]
MSCCEHHHCNEEVKILAVILDLDGTLLDTERATKGIVKEFLASFGKELDREKEKNRRLGMTHRESSAAIVKDYDLPLTAEEFIQEITPLYREKWLEAKALPGANRLVKHLEKHGVPIALASNSLRENIDAKISLQKGWKESFSVILGSDQVKSGKPSPHLFEEAAKKMGVDALHCLVIEDSLVGVEAAKAAKMKVVAVPARSEADCHSLANVVLNSLLEFQPEQWGLPPFDDWVDKALPIEPIHASGLFVNGSLSEVTENGMSAFPDQITGLFFGWIKVEVDRTFKALVSIGWHQCSCNANRKIHIWVIDATDDHISDQQIQILLVGYIKGLDNKEVASMGLEVLEEYKSIAPASLDKPMFIHHSHVPF